METAESELFQETNQEEHKATLESTFNTIFPGKQRETKITRAKKILGDLSSSYSDERLDNLVTDFQFLADSWLDLFEKGIFGGKTLKELLNE